VRGLLSGRGSPDGLPEVQAAENTVGRERGVLVGGAGLLLRLHLRLFEYRGVGNDAADHRVLGGAAVLLRAGPPTAGSAGAGRAQGGEAGGRARQEARGPRHHRHTAAVPCGHVPPLRVGGLFALVPAPLGVPTVEHDRCVPVSVWRIHTATPLDLQGEETALHKGILNKTKNPINCYIVIQRNIMAMKLCILCIVVHFVIKTSTFFIIN